MRELRIKAGLTQKEVAERLGVGTRTLNNWENGRHTPVLTLDKWLILAELYGVTVQELSQATRNKFQTAG
ncbi:MAG TPA: helix-turn-helix transcriptional regulator [Candidatus Obscuribacterales bacterium]